MVSNGGGALPGWAARHLAESGDPAAGARLLDDAPPRPRARHRVGRRPTPRDQGRLRGWALATVAVAAAVGTVPLAVSALVREDLPMPRVGTFPVVSPEDLAGEGGDVQARGGRDGTATTDPALAGVLPPPVVAPTAAARPLPSAADSRRAETPPRGPARGGARPAAAPAPTTSSTVPPSTTTEPAEPAEPVATEPRGDVGEDTGEDTGRDGSVTPRDASSTGPTTTTRPAPRRDAEGDGLLPGLVRGVGDTAGGLLR